MFCDLILQCPLCHHVHHVLVGLLDEFGNHIPQCEDNLLSPLWPLLIHPLQESTPCRFVLWNRIQQISRLLVFPNRAQRAQQSLKQNQKELPSGGTKEPATNVFAFSDEHATRVLTMTAKHQRFMHNTTPMRILYTIRNTTTRRTLQT